ncbi:MAG: leucyl/phenylalanyl-tRNA--protein transferase [Ignavibacteriaceae bacterium]|nr:leucyl/phenylalanyl-tRNA--protein transferase [Ignavibacteriaceae bacterium]
MSDHFNSQDMLSPGNMLKLYSMGAFPMAENKDDPEVNWYKPNKRAIIPLDNYNIPRSLKKELRSGRFDIRINDDFDRVIDGCADREETWINGSLKDAYRRLVELGYLFTYEVFRGDDLLGGLYGINIGGAFFGESMFTKKSQGSKIALAFLIERLVKRGFVLLDVQLLNPHLELFGAVEISEDEYNNLLVSALTTAVTFN